MRRPVEQRLWLRRTIALFPDLKTLRKCSPIRDPSHNTIHPPERHCESICVRHSAFLWKRGPAAGSQRPVVRLSSSACLWAELRATFPTLTTMNIRPHDRFSSEVTLTPEIVAEYARAAGDCNPVHFDAAFAAQTRYRRRIASGTQTTALLLGLTAAHFSKDTSMVGLEYWVRFRRPVFADETIRLEWLVIRVAPSPRLGGHIVDLRGRIRGQDGRTAVGAKGRVLVTDAL